MTADHPSPLANLRVIEMAGIGPTPMAATMLADFGADVVRIDRHGAPDHFGEPRNDVFGRGRRSVAVDLKHPAGVELVLDLCVGADVIIEGFRPGVMERLGLGPDRCLARNPDLVYGRMTGWGQHGPLAQQAGHDINYIAVAGALQPLGDGDRPPRPPLNLVGDFGGGAMFLVTGVLMALLATGDGRNRGQVVDAAMVDGVAFLSGIIHSQLAQGVWSSTRDSNSLDGSAPYYAAYETADGEYLAVGAMEPQFWKNFIGGIGLAGAVDLGAQRDRSTWAVTRGLVADAVRRHPLRHWIAAFDGVDACVAPVIAPVDSPRDAHLVERGTFTTLDGVVQPSPAPRLSRTPGRLSTSNPSAGADTAALTEWGIEADRLERLLSDGVLTRPGSGAPPVR